MNRFAESMLYEVITADPEWDAPEPVVGSLGRMDLRLEGPQRMMELAVPGVLEAVGQARMKREDLQRTALLVVLPEVDASTKSWGLQEFAKKLAARVGLEQLPLIESRALGGAGAFKVLAEAALLLRRGDLQRCLVVGVDSYFEPQRLRALDEAWRIKSVRGADGFIPGETACALVLEREDAAKGRGARVLGKVVAVAEEVEASPLTGAKHSSGVALCRALERVLPKASARWMLSDLNGESYRAFEWGLALSRMGEVLGQVARHSLPATSLGDIGAASGCMLIASAISGFERGYAPAREAIAWCASDSGLRTAVRIETVKA